jgi:tetratricopeptide (TPR) repeat protein
MRGLVGSAAVCAALAVLFGCVTEETTTASFSFEGSDRAEKGSSLQSKIEIVERQVKQLPERIDLRAKLAQLYFADDRYQDGIAEITRAIHKDPENARLHSILGRFHIFKNELSKAETSYRNVVRYSKPGFTGPRLTLGYVLAMQEKYDEAIAQFYEVLKLHPKQPTAHYYLGCCYDVLGVRDKAIEHFERAAEHDNPYQNKARGEIYRLKLLSDGGKPKEHFTDRGPALQDHDASGS